MVVVIIIIVIFIIIVLLMMGVFFLAVFGAPVSEIEKSAGQVTRRLQRNHIDLFLLVFIAPASFLAPMSLRG